MWKFDFKDTKNKNSQVIISELLSMAILIL